MQRREVWLTWMQMWPVQMSTAVVVSSKVSTTLVTYADVSTITGQEEGVAQGNPKLDCQYDALGTVIRANYQDFQGVSDLNNVRSINVDVLKEGMGMKIHYGEVGSCHLVDSKSN
ncbi:hypothetical protein D5086_031851 [Populus alba]|uniref:Uncharacterized protein n=2 Tax=Populus TaxID=3689 RepID=A0ACC4AKH6_POPAL|nr:hypothetical protein NC653_039521 [Populus alba x Populus x berolinensis]KAJ6957586.1 hypothetical protein NC653_039524 [Populus alba x Populus x berolinensis]